MEEMEEEARPDVRWRRRDTEEAEWRRRVARRRWTRMAGWEFGLHFCLWEQEIGFASDQIFVRAKAHRRPWTVGVGRRERERARGGGVGGVPSDCCVRTRLISSPPPPPTIPVYIPRPMPLNAVAHRLTTPTLVTTPTLPPQPRRIAESGFAISRLWRPLPLHTRTHNGRPRAPRAVRRLRRCALPF